MTGFKVANNFLSLFVQEEIKIISVTVFVNPYSELDEEEEKKIEDEKNAEDDENVSVEPLISITLHSQLLNIIACDVLHLQDKIGSWYSNPGTAAVEAGASSGGVGKYLKARNTKVESATAADTDLQSGAVVKKRKLGASTRELKDFSSW